VIRLGTVTGLPRKVLFVCTGNAGRSVIAEALFRAEAAPAFDVTSAGVRPWKAVHPMADKLMSEIGMNVSGHIPKDVRDFANMDFDLVVTIGDQAKAECPEFKSCSRRIHWNIPDPADSDDAHIEDAFRSVLQHIASRVLALRAIAGDCQ